MADQLQVAAVGAGWVTTHRHIPAMRATGRFRLRALVDRHPERAHDAVRSLGLTGCEVAGDLRDLRCWDEIGAVTCGTAPFSHAEVMRTALEAGKHAISEKPFTMDVAAATELRDLATDAGLTLAVIHNFQFARSVLTLKRWIDSGRLGTVRGIWAVQMSNPERRLPTWFDELPLGLFYDESPHLLYLVRALAGTPIEPLAGMVHPSTTGLSNTPAQIDLQLRAGTVPVTMLMSFEAPLSEWHVAVLGDRGVGDVDVFRDVATFAPNDGNHRAGEVLRTSVRMAAGHFLGQARPAVGHARGTLLYGNEEVFTRFADAVRSGSAPVGIGADDAVHVVELMQWVVGLGPSAPSPAARRP